MILGRKDYSLIALFVFFCSLTGWAQSQNITPQSNHDWEISIGGGYFSPAREGFRECDGSNLKYQIGVASKISRLTSLAIDLSYTRLSKSVYPVRYAEISIVPSIRVLWPKALFPYWGGGLGFYSGSIGFKEDENYFSQETGSYVDAKEKKFSETGLGFELYSGIRGAINSRMFLGLELRYSHTFLGDPHKGQHGDIGGFYILLKLGGLL
ncbi:MAG: hypothetical protein WCE90_01680 [Candidatus Zixiibacteriota bacterium]